MLAKLLKFILVTRFSKPLLIIIPLLAVYFIGISRSISSSGLSSGQEYTGIGFTTFMLVMPVLNGGLVVLKSDRDYLFTLPVDRRELAICLFIAQFLSFGLIGFFLVGYALPLNGSEVTLVETVIDFVCLSLLATCLGPVSYTLSLRKRILLVLALILWSVSPIFRFPFAISALFSGYGLEATISAVAVLAVLFPLAFRSLETVELGVMRSMISSSSSVSGGKGRSFVGMSPLRAIYSENFEVLEISGRMNMAGTGGAYRSTRIGLKRAVLITGALAVAYFIVVLHYASPAGASRTLGNSSVMMIAQVYLAISIVFVAMTVLGNERLWLGFSSMNPTEYLSNLVIAKAMALLVFISPFVVADIVLAIVGIPGALSSAIAVSVILPASLVQVVYLSGVVSPLQIKEDMMMPGQFNLRQMAIILPMFLTIGLMEASTFLLPFAIGASIFMVGVSFFLLKSKSAGNKVVESLVNNGFV